METIRAATTETITINKVKLAQHLVNMNPSCWVKMCNPTCWVTLTQHVLCPVFTQRVVNSIVCQFQAER